MRENAGFATVRWFAASLAAFSWLGRIRLGRRTDCREQSVRFEDLSPHILRDLGFSAQHARDLAAQERTRFLS